MNKIIDLIFQVIIPILSLVLGLAFGIGLRNPLQGFLVSALISILVRQFYQDFRGNKNESLVDTCIQSLNLAKNLNEFKNAIDETEHEFFKQTAINQLKNFTTSLEHDVSRLRNREELCVKFYDSKNRFVEKGLNCTQKSIKATFTGFDNKSSLDSYMTNNHRNYLQQQKALIQRGVSIKRIFIIPRDKTITDENISTVLNEYHDIGVEVFYICIGNILFDPEDYLIQDDILLVKFELPKGVKAGVERLCVNEQTVAHYIDDFNAILRSGHIQRFSPSTLHLCPT